MTTETQNYLKALRKDAELAESVRGKPLTRALVDSIVNLSKETGYVFTVGSAYELDKSTQFFRENAKVLRFFDCNGQEFAFSDKARPIVRNELFIGIRFFDNKRTARVYARF